MQCKCKSIKALVTLVLSKPCFLSLAFGHKHIPKLLRNEISKKINYLLVYGKLLVMHSPQINNQ